MAISRFIITLLFFSTLLFSSTFSQEPPPPIEWGEISMDDLAMTSYPADTNASAIILCDYGESRVNNEFEIVFKHHLRVKILNQTGYEWGTHSVILYDDREHGQKIDDIEGMTYKLVNGKIVKTEFDDDEVFEENVDDKYIRYKFTLPALEPGCIIEIRYRIISKSLWNVEDWTFQKDDPVLWSEYRLNYPAMMTYAIVTSGYEPLAIKETNIVQTPVANELAGYINNNVINYVHQRWACKNLSAIRKEPYITTTEDYFTKLDIQLAKFANRLGTVDNVVSTWDQLAKEMIDDDNYGEQCEPTRKVKSLVNEITNGLNTEEEKLKAIYDWVSHSIVSQGYHGKFSTKSINDILDEKKGYDAEVNFLLIAMLRAAGITVYPAMVSTRSNGKIQELYPILKQFNYTIGVAIANSKQFFLDATEPYRPYNLPPSEILGVRAFIIKPDLSELQTIATQTKSITIASANLNVDEFGSASGTISGAFKDYANISVREELKNKSKKDIAKQYFVANESGLNIDTVIVLREDSVDLPLIVNCNVSASSYAQAGGDFLYINPHVVSRWKDNPFKTKVRKFPIDYNYPQEFTTIVNIFFPDSFEVKEGLKDKELNLANDVKYRRQFMSDSSHIQLITKLSITKSVIEPRFYDQLKNLYATMISAESEQIVLERKQPPPPIQESPQPPVQQKKEKPKNKKKK